ncbi:MAG: hypothetical protein JHC33_12455 [Ignisphaera sp.]|nr:hypothetical protein [Ignisphaera sp.]
MRKEMRFSKIGIRERILIELRGRDDDDNFISLQEEFTVNEFLELAAQIIDKDPYYKDIFDKRLF